MNLAPPLRRTPCLAALIVALVLVLGCKKEEVGANKPATQVAAKVNAEEITVHQINNILARTPNVTPETADRVKSEILDKLVEQQLARQKAIEKKLDQSPNVVQAVEAAKSEILARAYMEQVAAVLPRPSAEETRKYYAEHPELFARRRIYSLEEIILVATDGVAAALREKVAKARSMQELADWLQARGVNFVPSRGVRTAEQLPLEILPKLQSMKDGDMQMFDVGGGRYRVVAILSALLEPVDEATAAPRIQQYLMNQRSSEAIAAEMKQIKAQAKIEYVGEFAGGPDAMAAKRKAEGDARTTASKEAKAKEEADRQASADELSRVRAAAAAKDKLEAALRTGAAPSKPADLPKDNLENGVRGLQ